MITFKNFITEGKLSKPETVEKIITNYNLHSLTLEELDLSSCGMIKLPDNVPSTIGGNLYLGQNKLSTFENFPKRVLGDMGIDLFNNKFTTLHNIHQHILGVSGAEGINLAGNPIKSHVLGLLKITGLKRIYLSFGPRASKLAKVLYQVEKIINKYLPEGDIIDCQEELIEAGLPEYAQL